MSPPRCALGSAAALAQEVQGAGAVTGSPVPRNVSVSQARLDGAARDANNFLHSNGSYAQTRYHAASQINKSNVGKLKPAFVFQTEVVESMETAPIVVDGIMYLTTSYNHIYAVDAKTGKEFWHYKHKQGPVTTYCCGPNNRGVAIMNDRVYMGTLDAKLLALDAKTGKVLWATADRRPREGLLRDDGAGGGERQDPDRHQRRRVRHPRLRQGVRRQRRQAVVDLLHDPREGSRGRVGRQRCDQPQHAARHRGREEAAGREAAAISTRRSAAACGWRRRSTRKPTRCSSWSATRAPICTARSGPGDNLYTDSIVAIDLNSGAYKWHYQYVAHDVWDLDAVSPVILTEAKDKAGKMRKVAVHGGKTGHVYVHDRATGELIRFSDAMIPQENMWVLPTANGARMLPGANGGVEWSPMAFNPKHRLVYAANLHQPMTYHVEEAKYPGGKLWLGGAFKVIPSEKQWGRLAAVNVDTGKIAWKVDTEQPLIGGVLTTAGDLVFNGEGNGMFSAFDAGSGKKLWSFNCGAGVNAPAVSYMVGGKQYIAVAAGGNTQLDFKRGNSVFVFALP